MPVSARRVLLCLTLLAAVFAPAASALAHAFSQSSSIWKLAPSGEVEAEFVLPAFSPAFLDALARELAQEGGERNGAPESVLAEYLASHTEIAINGQPCPLAAKPSPASIRENHLILGLRFTCPPRDEPANLAAAIKVKLRIDFFAALQQGHLHFAHIRQITQQGEKHYQQLFAAGLREAQFTPGVAQSTQLPPSAFFAKLAEYFPNGIRHILSGADHLAFLALLLLLARQWRTALAAMTGFTLGHSLTLALAAIGLFQPESRQVEALIGFTIFLAAAEGLALRHQFWLPLAAAIAAILALAAFLPLMYPAALTPVLFLGLALFTLSYGVLISTESRGKRALPFLAALFGLVHGFGFAGVLLEAGLPAPALLPALAGFNLGVEAGQIFAGLIFAALWLALLWVLDKIFPAARPVLVPLCFLLLAALGLFWFVQRTFLG